MDPRPHCEGHAVVETGPHSGVALACAGEHLLNYSLVRAHGGRLGKPSP